MSSDYICFIIIICYVLICGVGIGFMFFTDKNGIPYISDLIDNYFEKDEDEENDFIDW